MSDRTLDAIDGQFMEQPRDEASPPHPGLTRLELVIVVAAVVTLFAFVAGPIWKHPWSPNTSILYSYAPIPVIVALVLLRGRRLRWGSWIVGTMQVAITKFIITAFALVGMWAATNPAPQAREVPRSIASPTSASAPATAATIVVPSGAQVPPARPDVELALGGTMPESLEVPVGAPLRLRSADGRMHTFVAPSARLNVPLVPGETRTVIFAEPLELDVHCEVHPSEPHVRVVVTPAK